MKNRPWNNPRVVQMVPTLHSLPKHPEMSLPRFNPDDGLLVEEHIHNFMLAINLNGVTEEYFAVIPRHI